VTRDFAGRSRLRALRRTWAPLLVIAVAGSIGATVAAGVVIAVSGQAGTGAQVRASGAVVGFAFVMASSASIPSPAPAAPTGTSALPEVLLGGANSFCLGSPGCTSNNAGAEIQYRFNASFVGSVQVFVSANGSAQTVYFQQSALATSGTVNLYWDLGSAAPTILAVSTTAQQCTGLTGTCP
jgi:hypothetical protein